MIVPAGFRFHQKDATSPSRVPPPPPRFEIRHHDPVHTPHTPRVIQIYAHGSRNAASCPRAAGEWANVFGGRFLRVGPFHPPHFHSTPHPRI